jgi:uncharacterized membrane protein YbhN (UPF0104 family)
MIPAASTRSPHRVARLLGAFVALALVAAVLVLARPATVWSLLTSTDPGWLAAAAAAAAGAVAMRGVRLVALLAPGTLSLGTGVLVAAAAQAAALYAPARLGELALPWLLRRAAGRDLSSGVGTLVAMRALDVVTLALWAGGAALVTWGVEEPVALIAAGLLLAVPVAVPIVLAAGDQVAVRCLAPRGRVGRRWARRVRRLVVSAAEVRARPVRLAAAVVASVAMWGFLWAMSWLLLAAMGFRWPVTHVVTGASAASLGNLVPITVIGNVGTVEAAWTAAFTLLGVPLEIAAATGLACHVWALVFVAVYGAAAWLAVLTRSRLA